MSLAVFGSLDANLRFRNGPGITERCSSLHVLRRFGWPIHPTKCVGTTTAIQSFQALGTLADLAAQTFAVLPATMQRIPALFAFLLKVPPTFRYVPSLG